MSTCLRPTRRTFLRSTAAAATALWTAGPSVLRAQRGDKLRLAIIGCGGRGADNLESVASEHIAVLCDVDRAALDRAAAAYPGARKEVDFRAVFDHAGEFDAVVVSTTEHTHAFATLPALQLKKHVYCEKPLTHDVQEARIIREAAEKSGVATQMGTQVHASDNYRRIVELVQAGAVGPVRECHVWVARAWGRQSAIEAAAAKDIVVVAERPTSVDPVPSTLEWNLWLGPAPVRPFNNIYVPGPKWYRWWEFGNGTMSDLGSHWIDLPFWALKLRAPSTIEASGPPPHPEIAPASMQVRYEYEASGNQPSVTLTWYQGGRRPDLWTLGGIPQWPSGVLFVGDKGMLLCDYQKHVLLPEEKFKDFTPPPPSIPKSIGHHAEWVQACKTGAPTTCHFGYSGWLTEANHLGNVAYRLGRKLEWDPVRLRATNAPEADQFLRRTHREGWTLVWGKGSPGWAATRRTPAPHRRMRSRQCAGVMCSSGDQECATMRSRFVSFVRRVAGWPSSGPGFGARFVVTFWGATSSWRCTVNTRREFLVTAPLGLLGAAACTRQPQDATPSTAPSSAPAGAPPTFGSAPGAGPEVSAATFAEAERLARVTMTPRERDVAAASWRRTMAPMLERRTGPRQVALEPALPPATRWDPMLAGISAPSRDLFVRSVVDPGPVPVNDDALAFAPVTHLSRWIERQAVTSERLTGIYLARIERFDPKLRSIITLTKDLALARAKQADAEIAAGRYRGPLHGVPYGVKDLLDTAGIATTYGAEPFRNRVPAADSFVVRRLNDAGAVLLAKLSLGALALNDIWFGGQTMNPWLLEEGASGSSAGPGAATAAALVAFSIGSETGGSIVSPAMRCGITGLRPTFGRVARTGAMTLCWSLDKLGPMTRGVEDAMLVLQAISGDDAGDVSSVPSRLEFDATAGVKGLRVGYFPKWMQESPATDVDRAALETVRTVGMTPVEVALPDWPYSSLMPVLFAEGAAAFEELTLGGVDDQLTMQVPDAWPNLFRQARFLSAVDFVQADRLRRRVAFEMQRIFSDVDLLVVPSLRDEMLTISNFTGHPSLTLRAGFVQVGQARSDWAPDPAHPLPTFSPPRRVPHGVTLIGRLFDEGTLARAGLALERAFAVADERPPRFA